METEKDGKLQENSGYQMNIKSSLAHSTGLIIFPDAFIAPIIVTISSLYEPQASAATL